ncbi:hypothetical protein AND_004588 [Anopheles darlingi]|uniref:Uncharacterized protein n=1 Tax=Anopheles darlingi TaxID=43151 RepID=W5JH65_ANODA|nr:hypothetical protein AND_004588 [Anopheles darlingi]
MCHSTKIVLCLKCLPKADLMPDSILRDEEFHELLLGFDASDLDVFHSLGVMDVIVIPREARINVRFKKLLRKPLPKAVKLQKLFQAFPPVHRVRFRKYASKEEWFQVLSQKCVEITTFYLNERSLDLHDNFDLMVDRTPLHERTSNRSRGMSFPEDSFVMRHPVSQPHTHNVSRKQFRRWHDHQNAHHYCTEC